MKPSHPPSSHPPHSTPETSVAPPQALQTLQSSAFFLCPSDASSSTMPALTLCCAQYGLPSAFLYESHNRWSNAVSDWYNEERNYDCAHLGG